MVQSALDESSSKSCSSGQICSVAIKAYSDKINTSSLGLHVLDLFHLKENWYRYLGPL